MNTEAAQSPNLKQLPEAFGEVADWKQHLINQIGAERDIAVANATATPGDETLAVMADLRAENVRLISTVVERAEELGIDEGDMQKTSALLSILHKASPKTFGHALRVSLGASTVADHVKADTEFADDENFASDVFLAALNHDVGKAESKVGGEWLLDVAGERVVPDELTLSAYALHCTDEDIGDWRDKSPGSLVDQFKRHSEAGKLLTDFVGLPNFVGDVAGTHHVLQFSPAGMIDHYESLDDRTKLMVTSVTLADGQDARMSRNDRKREYTQPESTADQVMQEAAVGNQEREQKMAFVKDNAAHILRATGLGQELPDAELGDEVSAIVHAVEVGRRGEPSVRAAHPADVGPRDMKLLDDLAEGRPAVRQRITVTDRFAVRQPKPITSRIPARVRR